MNSRLVSAVLASLLCTLALGQQPAPAPTLESLQKEQQRLSTELDKLRGEIQALKALVEQLRRDLADGVDTPEGPTLAQLDKKLDRVLSEMQALKTQPAQTGEQKRPAMELAGKPAPVFQIGTRAGHVVSNGEFGNYRATVLNFVAPNCGFCQRQIPKVEKVRQEFEPTGVRFVNVSEQMGTQTFTPEDAEAKYLSYGSGLELAIDSGNAVGKLFKATAYPTMFVVRADGVVQHVNVGAKDNIDEMLRQQLTTLLGGGAPTTQPAAKPAGS